MQVVLISGASRGIGREIAARLEARGHSVYAGIRDGGELPPGTGAGRIVGVPLDVTDAGSVDRALSRVIDEEGRVDCVINNAGVLLSAAAEEMPDEDLHHVMEVNFFGAVRLTRAALPHMRKRGQGRIIMMSSLSGLAGLPLDGAYAASKHALEGWSESLAAEVGRFGISVHLLEPGGVETDMTRPMPADRLDPEEEASPYAPLRSFMTRARPDDQGSAMPPTAVADHVAGIIDGEITGLRHPIGETAERVTKALRRADDQARRTLLEEAAGTAWWSQGRPAPDGADEA